MYATVIMKSSLTHCTSGWPESHSSMCTVSILQLPIQMPPHSRQSHIFKRAFAHLMMHECFSLLFMPNDTVWVAVKAWWSCACVAERRWSRIRRVTATDSEMVVGGVEVVRVQGTETIKEWSYWWLKGNSIRNNSALIRKRSVNWNYRQTDRRHKANH